MKYIYPAIRVLQDTAVSVHLDHRVVLTNGLVKPDVRTFFYKDSVLVFVWSLLVRSGFSHKLYPVKWTLEIRASPEIGQKF